MTNQTDMDRQFRAKVWRWMLLGLALFWLAVLSACGNVDALGYRMPPTASLAGVQALVRVVPQDELNARAYASGAAQRGMVVHGLATTIGTFCLVDIAPTRAGMAAVEHELHHCAGWSH